MKKPLNFCLLATTGLLALSAMDHVKCLELSANVYDILQLMLAGFSVGCVVLHLSQRLRKKPVWTGPLLLGIVAGTLAGTLATQNPALGTQMGGAGSFFLHTAIGALFVNAFLCLFSYGEMDSRESVTVEVADRYREEGTDSVSEREGTAVA